MIMNTTRNLGYNNNKFESLTHKNITNNHAGK